MRLHVHAHDINILTFCDGSSTVFELRKVIEQQYNGLNPTSPPLATHALRDKDHYLLPDTLFVKDVLNDSDKVFVVLEKELRPVSETDLSHVLQRWQYFQKYTLLSISNTVKSKLMKAHGTNGIVRFGQGTVFVLTEMLTSTDVNIVAQACDLLRKVLCEPQGDPNNLGKCDSLADPAFQCAKWICTLALYTRDDTIAHDCCQILASCLKNTYTRSCMIKSGAPSALMHLGRSEESETRRIAASGLLYVTNSDKKEHQSLLALPGQVKNRSSGEEKASHNLDAIRTLDDAMNALEVSDLIQVHQVALETILRECGEESMRQTTVLKGQDLVRALNRACRFNNPKLGLLVADIFVRLSMGEDESSILYEKGGFEILLTLLEEEEDSMKYKLSEGKAEVKISDIKIPFNELQYGNQFRSVCQNEVIPCPSRILINTLVQSGSSFAREIVAETILSVIKKDEPNEFASYIAQILSAASQAEMFSKEQLYLGQSVSLLGVKEINKARLIRYGAPKFCLSLLQTNRVELQRIGAKALANLASSTTENRSTIIDYVQSKLAPVQSFQDTITSMYLEMIFTAD